MQTIGASVCGPPLSRWERGEDADERRAMARWRRQRSGVQVERAGREASRVPVLSSASTHNRSFVSDGRPSTLLLLVDALELGTWSSVV